MKNLTIALLLCLGLTAHAGILVSVTVDTNSVLRGGQTNIFDANISNLTNALTKAGFSVSVANSANNLAAGAVITNTVLINPVIPTAAPAQFVVLGSGTNLLGTLDGSSLTNLNASHISSGTYTGNGSGLTNLSGTVVAASAPETLLRGDQIYEAPPQAIWGAQTKPLLLCVMSPYPRVTVATPQDTETTIVDKLNWWLPFLPGITNAGWDFAFHIDVGWAGRRNFNPSYVMTNNGSFTSDTNMFPHGMPWLINKLNTNGIQVILGFYAFTNTIPSGASGMMIPIEGGGNFYPYTNGVGTGLIASNTSGPHIGWKMDELVTADTVYGDFWQARWWGVKGIILNTVAGCDDKNTITLDKQVNTACQQFYEPLGFNQTQGATFFNINPTLIDWSKTNNWKAVGSSISGIYNQPLGFFTNLPPCAFYPYEGRYSDITSYGTWTAIYKNGTVYQNADAPVTVRDWTGYFAREYAGIDTVKNGARPISAPQTSFGANSLLPLIASENFEVDSASTNQMTNLLVCVTNATFAAIANDRLQLMPKKLLDYPGWFVVIGKPLVNGDTALEIQYEGSTNGSLIMLNYASDLGLNLGVYSVTNLYCNSGGLSSSSAGSFTISMNPSSAMLLRISPILARPIDTNAISWDVDIGSLNGATFSAPNNGYSGYAAKIGFNDNMQYVLRTPMRGSFITNAVSTFWVYAFGGQGQCTNTIQSLWWSETTGDSGSASATVPGVVKSGGLHQFIYQFTNTFPDTNFPKVISYTATGASNNTYMWVERWHIDAYGPNRGTNF